jgi:hypothetical protein
VKLTMYELGRLAVLRWALFLLAAVGSTSAAPAPNSVRDADARCKTCHASIFETYVRTPMANASGSASEQVHEGTLRRANSGATYEIRRHEKDLILVSRESAHPEDAEEVRLLYFLGSGHLGTTYLYSINNYLFESPIAWYAASQSLDMKPGVGQGDSPVPALRIQSNCLRCHMSGVKESDPGSLNRYSGSPFLHSGITCEACHGDSDRHVNSNGKEPIVNPARLDASLRDSVCLSCHLEGDISVERAGRSAVNYRPGEQLSDYLSFYVWKDANATARGVSEVEQLAQSMCKRMSGDRMSCTTCHDPHADPDAGHRVEFFRAKCLACHNQPEFTRHFAQTPDCTSCHMPRTSSTNILHVAWTDHRILRRQDSETSQPSAESAGKLVDIFSPQADARDLAMANYQAFLGGNQALANLAWEQLSGLRNHAGKDKDLLDAFGTVASMRGELSQAEQAFREALLIDPRDVTALSNLGTLLGKQGRMTESAAILKKAFDQNEDVAGLAMNLARAECAAGDAEGARNTLNTALEYSPFLARLQQLLKEAESCRVPAERLQGFPL